MRLVRKITRSHAVINRFLANSFLFSTQVYTAKNYLPGLKLCLLDFLRCCVIFRTVV